MLERKTAGGKETRRGKERPLTEGKKKKKSHRGGGGGTGTGEKKGREKGFVYSRQSRGRRN